MNRSSSWIAPAAVALFAVALFWRDAQPAQPQPKPKTAVEYAVLSKYNPRDDAAAAYIWNTPDREMLARTPDEFAKKIGAESANHAAVLNHLAGQGWEYQSSFLETTKIGSVTSFVFTRPKR